MAYLFSPLLMALVALAPAVEMPKGPVPEVHIETQKIVWPDETLRRICACESRGNPNAEPTHYEADGVTVRYGRVNPADRGACQINAHYHKATALNMGHDIETEHGNIAYATWLYKTQGTRPWHWSRQCWGT